MIPKENHKSCEELHKLVTVEVFRKHTYSYKPGNKEPAPLRDEEELYEEVYEDVYDKANSLLAKFAKRTSEQDSAYEQILYTNPGNKKKDCLNAC